MEEKKSGGINWNEISANSNGGTELLARRLENSFSEEFLDDFQIILSRVRDLNPEKIRVLFLHDLPPDPESHHLKNEGWRKFHIIVFVSYWQREWYMREYNIPYSHTRVIRNAIYPDGPVEKPDINDKVRIIYHSTPHRGLDILYSVFENLAKDDPNIHLDVYSSFEIYGWKARDEEYKPLFEKLVEHPQITYHGFKPNEVVREALTQSHIFAYPSTWMETSCLCLMEAMSAKCLCVHSDLGALPETSAAWTYMYDYHEDKPQHAARFHQALKIAIDNLRNNSEAENLKLSSAKSYADLFYNWNVRKHQWESVLKSLLHLPREIQQPTAEFVYRV